MTDYILDRPSSTDEVRNYGLRSSSRHAASFRCSPPTPGGPRRRSWTAPAFFPATAIVLAGPHLGLAQAALDRVITKTPGKAIVHTRFTSRSETAVTQIAVAKAASLVDTAHLLAYRAAADIDEVAHLGVVPDARARARVRMDMAASIVNAREAIGMLLSAHGASSFAESEPLQRIWRDCEVASRHAVAHSEINAQLYGQALLGVPIDVTPLV